MDESEHWQRNLGRQSSVKDWWPHDGDKPSDPSKSLHSSRGGFRRESGSDSQDETRQEQSYHHNKSSTDEFLSSEVGSGNAGVPASVRTTQTQPKTTPCVQEIPQPTPIKIVSIPGSGEQPSTTLPYVAKHLATQSQTYTSSGQRSVKEHVVLKYRPSHAEVSSMHLLCQYCLCVVSCALSLWSTLCLYYEELEQVGDSLVTQHLCLLYTILFDYKIIYSKCPPNSQLST